jgi:hypothetical protein
MGPLVPYDTCLGGYRHSHRHECLQRLGRRNAQGDTQAPRSEALLSREHGDLPMTGECHVSMSFPAQPGRSWFPELA